MKGLVDAHAFIWWYSDPSRLSAAALAFFQNPSSIVLVRVVSVWEIVIKCQLGKMTLRDEADTFISAAPTLDCSPGTVTIRGKGDSHAAARSFSSAG